MIQYDDKNLEKILNDFDEVQNSKIASPGPIPIESVGGENTFPLEALGELSGLVLALHASVQAPLSMCAQAVLAAVNLCVQGHVNVACNPIQTPLSLYFLTVALSGERKTTLDSVVLRPHRDWQRSLQIEYRKALNEFMVKKAAFDSGVRSGKLVLVADKPIAPLKPEIIVNDFTTEGLLKGLDYAYPSQGAFLSEGGLLTGGFAMNGENAMKTVATLSSLWDGTPYSKSRGTTDSTYVEGKRFCLHVMIQPSVGSEFLFDPRLHGQGIHGRFLLICPTSTIGRRPFKEIDIYENVDFKKYYQKVAAIYKVPLRYIQGSTHELDPRTILLSEEAKAEWVSFHDYVEEKLISEGEFTEIQEFAAKVPTILLRVAGTLAAFEDIGVEKIGLKQLKNAIQICQFYISEKIRFQRIKGEEELHKRSIKMLAFLRSLPQRQISAQTIMQNGPVFVRSRAGLDVMMTFLEDRHWVEPVKISKRNKRVLCWVLTAGGK